MRVIAAFTIGVLATFVIVTNLLKPDTIHTSETFVETRIVTNEVITTIDLEQLREDFAQIAEDLRRECLYIIERTTGDPMPGIIHHVDRHYQGDACRAADEALTGGW